MFQRLIDTVLLGCEEFAKVYIDDILVVSESSEEHIVHLRKLFGVLKKEGLTCKRSKCSFGRRRLEFLGHVVGEGVIDIPGARAEALRRHPRPKSRRQLREFLGTINYYRRFIQGFHECSSLLTPSTFKTAPGIVEWSKPMVEAFDLLKDKLLCHVCLTGPCMRDVFVLETDASGTGIGAVLSVEREGKREPVAFFSMQLRGAQLRYSAQELEGLGLFESVRHFAFYLYGRTFTVVTDHRSLESLMTAQQHNRRLYNWALKLTEFDFVVEYRKGRDNVVADCLSRRVGECIEEGEKTSSEEGGDVGVPT